MRGKPLLETDVYGSADVDKRNNQQKPKEEPLFRHDRIALPGRRPKSCSPRALAWRPRRLGRRASIIAAQSFAMGWPLKSQERRSLSAPTNQRFRRALAGPV